MTSELLIRVLVAVESTTAGLYTSWSCFQSALRTNHASSTTHQFSCWQSDVVRVCVSAGPRSSSAGRRDTRCRSGISAQFLIDFFIYIYLFMGSNKQHGQLLAPRSPEYASRNILRFLGNRRACRQLSYHAHVYRRGNNKGRRWSPIDAFEALTTSSIRNALTR